MQMWKQSREPLKNLLILLLSASALFLMWKSNVFSVVLPEENGTSAAKSTEGVLSIHEAAQPMTAVVTGSGGLRYGAKYDPAAIGSLYTDFSADLSEALGSGSGPVQISEKSWRKLLCGKGLYLDYGCSLPLELLAEWLGVSAPWAEGRSARSILLSGAEDDTVVLSWWDGKKYTSCRSAAGWLSLSVRLESYFPNGAEFAFESAGLQDAAPYELLLENLPDLSAAAAVTEQQTAAGVLAEQFGLNLSVTGFYEESDGTLVYPGENAVFRLYSTGEIRISAPEGLHLAPADRISAFVEQVRRLLEQVRGCLGGEETLRLADFAVTETGAEVRFCCCLEGLPVTLAEGYAAWAVWDGGGITELSVLPRSYHLAEPITGILPEKQAAAAAGSQKRGSEALLTLYDSGKERAEPLWAVR